MNCSRCAAELPDSATFCPRCGTTTTSGPFTTSTFSYLPAGAPPWPATVPPKPVYTTDTVASVQAASPGPASKPKRSTGSIVTTVALIVLAPLIGVGITLAILASQGLFPPGTASARPKTNTVIKPAQATATPSAVVQGNQLPTPTSFKTTSSKDVNASVQYPGDWVADSPQKETNFTQLAIHPPQSQQITINFYIVRYTDAISATVTSPDEINQANVTGISQQQGSVSNFQTLPAPATQPTIGGTQWTEEEATYVDTASSVKVHFVTISAQHNKVYYNIAFIMPDQYYNEALQKYIQHMLDTFQFLS